MQLTLLARSPAKQRLDYYSGSKSMEGKAALCADTKGVVVEVSTSHLIRKPLILAQTYSVMGFCREREMEGWC